VQGSQADGGVEIAAIEADLSRLVRRLRGLSAAAWRSRKAPVEDLLAGLERFTAQLEGRPPRPLPEVPDYARADAVAVLAGDAVARLDEVGNLAGFSALSLLLERALAATR
jgi:hypothetical protein